MFELLNKIHNKQGFDCGNNDINRYLQQMASQHAKKGIAQTYVLTDGNTIKGFYTLSNAYLDNTAIMITGYPRQIPAILIGRMGVDIRYKGQGYSKKLIANALHTIKEISQKTGIAFVIIDAKDTKLWDYYQRLGFQAIPDSLTLILAVKKI